MNLRNYKKLINAIKQVTLIFLVALVIPFLTAYFSAISLIILFDLTPICAAMIGLGIAFFILLTFIIYKES